MAKNKKHVEIQDEYFQQIEQIVAQSSQFQTVSDYVNFVLKEMLYGDSDSDMNDAEEDLIKKRLEKLGYM